MYDSVFLSSFGSNIYETVGCLESIKNNLSNTIIWNSIGNSSLIVFFKILGFNFIQTFSFLKEFDLIHTFINGFCIIPEDEDEKRNYIKSWLIDKIEINNLISKDTTLEEIYKLTNLFPNFIVWSRTKSEHVMLNPKNYPSVNIIDAILATLPSIGTYSEITIEEEIYSGYFVGNFYPHEKRFNLEKKPINCLYISHISTNFFDDFKLESPFSYIENELINQFTESNNSRVKSLELENLIIIHNDIYRNSITPLKKDFCFENGKIQGSNYLEGSCNFEYYKTKKTEIVNQK